jgi:hypothetical protein
MIFYVCFRSGGNKLGFFAGGPFLASTLSTGPDKELQCPDDRNPKVDIYVSELTSDSDEHTAVAFVTT